MDCLTDDTISALLLGELAGPALQEIESHLAGCGRCRAIWEEAARLSAGDEPEGPPADPGQMAEHSGVWSRPPPPLGPGLMVGRYTLVEEIGVGAAGTVYRALDARLRRQIALKVLAVVDPSGPAATRWLREAQVMAQLSHPNVVQVFDADAFEGNVYIAMELVGGKTLAQFLAERRHGWREILNVFGEAGRGLAAAHAAGLVHRDFKPENVLVGDDGRIRVTDFGLARPAAAEDEAPERLGGGLGAGPRALALTSAGDLIGTPAYMAPEQFLRRPVDARTDQFGFCVALYIALYGGRPFGDRAGKAETVQSLAGHVTAGHLNPPPPATGVPPWIFGVVSRGLETDQARRFASMNDLLGALASGLGRRQRAWVQRVLLGAAVMVVAALVTSLMRVRAGTCGDGIVRAGVEECDDGNRVEGDGCTSQCLVCGGAHPGVEAEGGRCYVPHDEPLAWQEARGVCWSNGGHLVTYVRADEVETAMRALHEDPRPRWTGLLVREGALAWETGEPIVKDSINLDWRKDPAGTIGGAGVQCGVQQPAAVMDRLRAWRGEKMKTTAQIAWEGRSCAEPFPFICERSPWRVRQRGAHAYRVNWSPMPWAEARVACGRLGARLVSLTDQEEDAFVRALVHGPLWLGASNDRPKGPFQWVTGEPFTYQNFAPREPDAATLLANCLAVDVDGLWHDRSCGEKYVSICELD